MICFGHRFIARLYPFHAVNARGQAGLAERFILGNRSQIRIVQKDLHTIHVCLNDEAAQRCGSPLRSINTSGVDTQDHVIVVIAVVISRRLRFSVALHITTYFPSNVVNQFLCRDHTIAGRRVGISLQTFLYEVGKNSKTKAGVLITAFASPRRGQIQETRGKLSKLGVDRFIRGPTHNLAGMACIDKKHFPFCLQTSQILADRIHRVASGVGACRVHIPRSQIALAPP